MVSCALAGSWLAQSRFAQLAQPRFAQLAQPRFAQLAQLPVAISFTNLL